uniref:Uncharacterized protein n=1 Tax=Rousettus aegyptiacus TaxID=9407 RepID=A0A7J8H287_ROUAE|nr:hypothetical protein HJG63_011456 [Rousettus aegyptiacus]
MERHRISAQTGPKQAYLGSRCGPDSRPGDLPRQGPDTGILQVPGSCLWSTMSQGRGPTVELCFKDPNRFLFLNLSPGLWSPAPLSLGREGRGGGAAPLTALHPVCPLGSGVHQPPGCSLRPACPLRRPSFLQVQGGGQRCKCQISSTQTAPH